MDCSKVVIRLIEYFRDGYRRDSFCFFSRSIDTLREELREKYFDKFREGKDYYSDDAQKRPRTVDFISAVKLEVLLQLRERKPIDFSASNGSINDPHNLVDRSIENLRRLGYGYLIDGK